MPINRNCHCFSRANPASGGGCFLTTLLGKERGVAGDNAFPAAVFARRIFRRARGGRGVVHVGTECNRGDKAKFFFFSNTLMYQIQFIEILNPIPRKNRPKGSRLAFLNRRTVGNFSPFRASIFWNLSQGFFPWRWVHFSCHFDKIHSFSKLTRGGRGKPENVQKSRVWYKNIYF